MQNGNSDVEIRSNAIRTGRLDTTESGGYEDKSLSEVVNASEYSCMGDSETVEAQSFNAAPDSSKKRNKEGVNEKINLNQQLQDTSSYLSGYLLPTEVICLIYNCHDFSFDLYLIDLFFLTNRLEIY